MTGQDSSHNLLQIDRTFLWSWGANSHGQLGVADTSDRLISSDAPVPLSSGYSSEVIEDSGGGGGFSFILTESGKLFTCGNNNKGQLGQSDVESLMSFSLCKVLSQVKIVKVAAGWDFLLALSDTGSVLSWGSNVFGQLGRTLSSALSLDAVPDEIFSSTQRRHIDIAAGLRHGVALSECGKIYTWGHGKRGQLGQMDSKNKPLIKSEHPVQVHVADGEQPVQAVAGMYHSGILTESGTIFLWGCNKYGQCGQDPGATQTVLAPRMIACTTSNNGDGKVVSMASGWTHIIARTGSGFLYSWGRADLGQLGRSCEKSCDHIPNLVAGLINVKNHACGSEHTLAVTENGLVYAWGWNEHGICGTGDEENVPQPHHIPQFHDRHVIRVGCGAGHSFCIARCLQVENRLDAPSHT